MRPPSLDGLWNVRGVLPGKVWIGPGDVDRPGGAAIAGDVHLDSVQLEGEDAGEAVVGDELPLLGQKLQHGGHVLVLALQRDGFHVLAALVLRQLLFQKVHQGVVDAVLLKVGAGDARRVLLGAEVIDLTDFPAVLAPGDGGGIAGRRRVRRQGGGDRDQRQKHRGHEQGYNAFHGGNSSFNIFHSPEGLVSGGYCMVMLPRDGPSSASSGPAGGPSSCISAGPGAARSSKLELSLWRGRS